MKTGRKTVAFLLLIGTAMLTHARDVERSHLHVIPEWIHLEKAEYQIGLNVFGYDRIVLDEWMQRAQQKKAWVAVSGDVFEVEVSSVILGESAANDFPLRSLVVSFRSRAPIGDRFGVFSFDPLPKQTWKKITKSIVETVYGDFRLQISPSKEEAEFQQYEIDVQRRVDGGKWKSIHHFTDQSASWVADFDGDGVPAILCITGYEDIALRRVWPMFQDVIVNASGVGR
jgi:hypothetical protein